MKNSIVSYLYRLTPTPTARPYAYQHTRRSELRMRYLPNNTLDCATYLTADSDVISTTTYLPYGKRIIPPHSYINRSLSHTTVHTTTHIHATSLTLQRQLMKMQAHLTYMNHPLPPPLLRTLQPLIPLTPAHSCSPANKDNKHIPTADYNVVSIPAKY